MKVTRISNKILCFFEQNLVYSRYLDTQQSGNIYCSRFAKEFEKTIQTPSIHNLLQLLRRSLNRYDISCVLFLIDKGLSCEFSRGLQEQCEIYGDIEQDTVSKYEKYQKLFNTYQYFAGFDVYKHGCEYAESFILNLLELNGIELKALINAQQFSEEPFIIRCCKDLLKRTENSDLLTTHLSDKIKFFFSKPVVRNYLKEHDKELLISEDYTIFV